jgi:hypothetical protein
MHPILVSVGARAFAAMLRRAARGVAEAAARTSGKVSSSAQVLVTSVAKCESAGCASFRGNAGARRGNSGVSTSGDTTTTGFAVKHTTTSPATPPAPNPEQLVRSGKTLEFAQAAELVFSSHGSGGLGLAAAYAWAQHILATDPEIKRMVSEARDPEGSFKIPNENSNRSYENGNTNTAAKYGASTDDAGETAASAQSIGDAVIDLRRRLANLESTLAEQQRRAGVKVEHTGSIRGSTQHQNREKVKEDSGFREKNQAQTLNAKNIWSSIRRTVAKIGRRKGIEEE